ncbi:MAG TPA: hypothetical protein VMB35_04020 [Methanomicrobiales archaeon]|nr:hypothetical protein [Methanomicrobiales archaeon]
MIGIIVGVVLLGVLIAPVSAGCSFRIHKCQDTDLNGVCTEIAGSHDVVASEALNNWEFIITPPASVLGTDDCTVEHVFTALGRADHTYDDACASTGWTITEVPQTGWTNVVPGNGPPPFYAGLTCAVNSETIKDFINEPTPSVPEFPTIAVSLASLVGIGLVVMAVRKKLE